MIPPKRRVGLPASIHPDMILWAHSLLREIATTRDRLEESETRHTVKSNDLASELYQLTQRVSQLDVQASTIPRVEESFVNRHAHTMAALETLQTQMVNVQDDMIKFVDSICLWKSGVEEILVTLLARDGVLEEVQQQLRPDRPMPRDPFSAIQPKGPANPVKSLIPVATQKSSLIDKRPPSKTPIATAGENFTPPVAKTQPTRTLRARPSDIAQKPGTTGKKPKGRSRKKC